MRPAYWGPDDADSRLRAKQEAQFRKLVGTQVASAPTTTTGRAWMIFDSIHRWLVGEMCYTATGELSKQGRYMASFVNKNDLVVVAVAEEGHRVRLSATWGKGKKEYVELFVSETIPLEEIVAQFQGECYLNGWFLPF